MPPEKEEFNGGEASVLYAGDVGADRIFVSADTCFDGFAFEFFIASVSLDDWACGTKTRDSMGRNALETLLFNSNNSEDDSKSLHKTS
jgi:hypothetical protein